MKELDEIGAASGLDVALCCPRCGARVMLVDRVSELRESECPKCAGALLAPDGARALVDHVLSMQRAMFEQLVERGRPSSMRCLRCHGQTQHVSLRGTGVDLCSKCGAMWIDHGGLHALTGGRFGQKPAAGAAPPRPHSVPSAPFAGAAPVRHLRPAPPRPAASGSKNVLYFGIAFLVAVLGGAGFAARTFLSKPPPPPPPPVEAPIELAKTIAPPPGAPVSAAGAEDFVFAGRDLAWWSKRLTTLRARNGDDAKRLYELTKQRAEQNGLAIVETPERVEAKVSKELLQKMGTRGGGT